MMAHYRFHCLFIITIRHFWAGKKKYGLQFFVSPALGAKCIEASLFFFSSLQSASLLFHLSLSFFSFPLSLPSLSTVWRDLHVALVYVTPRAFRSENSNSIISLSLSHITTFPAMGKLQISFFFFSNLVSSRFMVCWVVHCPCVKVNTPPWLVPAEELWPQWRHISQWHINIVAATPHWVTHGLVQYLHCLHVGMWGQSRGTGVIPTIVVGAVCLPCLTSIVESVDETCCEGRLQYLQCLPAAQRQGKTPGRREVFVLVVQVHENDSYMIVYLKRTYAAWATNRRSIDPLWFCCMSLSQLVVTLFFLLFFYLSIVAHTLRVEYGAAYCICK